MPDSAPQPLESATLSPATTVVSVTPTALGADSRTLKQAASLARAGYRSIVVEGLRSGESFAELGIELHCIESRERRSKNRYFGLGAVARFVWREAIMPFRAIPPGDLYVLHSYRFWPGVRLKCLIERKRYVYDAHDFYSKLEPADGSRLRARYLRNPTIAFLDRAAARHAVAMTTVSDGLAELYASSIGAQPIVLRNVHDRRLDRKESPSIREAIGLATDHCLVVVVGNRKPGMDLDALLSAIRALPETVHLAFVGKGYEPISTGLKDDPISRRVHCFTSVANRGVVPLIRGADIGALAYFPYTVNHVNALPNGFFQMIAAGLPLLFPPLPEIQRLAAKHELGVEIDPRSAASIVRAIQTLRGDAALRRRCSLNAASAGAELAWENEEQQFLDLVAGALKPCSKRSPRTIS
jgi:glycosyltransferase involved in cell wall biosynthesis